VQADLDIWLKAMAGGEVTAQEWRRYFTSKERGATILNESFSRICIVHCTRQILFRNGAAMTKKGFAVDDIARVYIVAIYVFIRKCALHSALKNIVYNTIE
jgi:hypothetical protein